MSKEKLSFHAAFNEAHYMAPVRPPGAQLLFDVGVPHDITEESLVPNPSRTVSYPPVVKTTTSICTFPTIQTMLPLAEYDLVPWVTTIER